MKKILWVMAFWGLMVGGVGAAQQESLTAAVREVVEEKTIAHPGVEQLQLVQTLRLEILAGERRGEIIEVENGNVPVANLRKYQVGDELVIYHDPSLNTYTIADVVRTKPLLILALIFVVAAIVVGRGKGLAALLGVGISFGVIFALILPQIEAGANPVLMVVMGSVIIIPIVFLLSHGWQKKTLVAIISTLFCMVITGILIIVFVDYANLTGLESEEAGFIKAMSADLINLKNLLIAGMLIAILGVLDDITVAQAGIVSELKAANPQLSGKELYQRAMKIGQDHIASMINTLILVYAGASFPLLLLFLRSGQGITLTLNFEVVASEIVRTLTGSLGLIMAVPLTTFLAVMGEVMFKSAPKKFKSAKRNSSLKGE